MPDRKDISEHTSNFPAPATQLAPGIILNARYLIVRPLHQGETGSVYLAVDRILGRNVAIKELSVDPEHRERTIRRFERYASILSKLSHSAIPAVYDSFLAEQFSRFYVVMEYVEGTNLVALIHDTPGGRLDEKTVTEFGMQVADALDYLHTRMVPFVCKNLEPSRLVVRESGNRVMMMFWLGQWTSEEKPGTAFGQTMGYASPESFEAFAERRTDVYSLGATMVYLLTGVHPKNDAISDLQIYPQSPELPELPEPPLISHQMKWILTQALEYRPEDRFSAGELRDALAELRLVQSTQVETPPPEEIFINYNHGEPRIYLDHNVQFTVYRPNKIKPLKWFPLLAYAHLTEPRDADDGDDPIARVQEEAERIMRDQKVDDFRQASEDSLVAIPRRGEISFVPFISGVDFNPSRASFFWEESVHRVDFRMRASAALEGKTARGRMSIFLGAILLAEINLSVQVTSRSHVVQTQREQPVRPYRHIFPSYSHKDREIVAQIEHYAQTTGDRYMRDVFELRSGQNWKKWMAETIKGADIFQLFWSTNSMRSENVRLEWEYALRLGREHFIRPTYWETPLPASPSENLPPPELRDLHFQHVRPPAYVEIPQQNHVEPNLSSQLEADWKREEVSRWFEQEKNQEIVGRRRDELAARKLAEEEARKRAEEKACRRAEILAAVEAHRLTEEEAAELLAQRELEPDPALDVFWNKRSRTTQSRPPLPHAAKPLLWLVVPIVVVLGLLLLLLVAFLIWRN